ncbi:MAG: MMPL family transporter [Bacteroidetes bacterium]|nr:MMPL family transporter [Bacteroidota bacterium]
MYKKFASILLKNKLVFVIAVSLATVFMAYKASQMQLSYEFAKILPDTDSAYTAYKRFKQNFGEDGNVMVMGFADSNLFETTKLNGLLKLSREIKAIDGIRDVLSIPLAYNLVLNDSAQKINFVALTNKSKLSNVEADSLKHSFLNLPFYDGFLYNKKTNANLIAITFHRKDLNSPHRLKMVKDIVEMGDTFGKNYGIEMHYSGMPFIRTVLMKKISSETTLFLILAIIVTSIILWFFFRALNIVFFSLVIVLVGVVWSIGIMECFGYKITVLSGLLAPIIMVIGLPNCIFLINKYQREFVAHQNKLNAISKSIETIGISLFLANITTAIGFGVLYFTHSSMLVEFGIISSISVMATYFITLILIPIMLNILPTPIAKHTKHQDGKIISAFLNKVNFLVQNKRKAIYISTTIITLISIIGFKFIDMNGFVVDDLPEKDPVFSDLRFFEKNFNGVLPFEISIDTKKENGVFSDNARTLYKIKRLEKLMAEYPQFSKPLSVIEAVKFSYQAFKGGESKYYKLPSIDDLRKLTEYTGSIKGQNKRLANFLDTIKQNTRVSYQCADIGSKKMKVLLDELKPKIDSIFEEKNYNVQLTGHSLVFLKSNDYLLSNLIESLIIEIVLIAVVGIFLFRSVRIIVLSKLPCLIPLAITAGIMGYLNIRFKPSTILIFSIAFGISSDGTIYFLTKYKQELKNYKHTAGQAISAAIKDTGLSMVYTNIILFCGFAIFSASSFGGTIALGVLVSLTLLLSMFTNLILLPAILLSIHNKKFKKEMLQDSVIDLNNQ